jgi:hypothetical protein
LISAEKITRKKVTLISSVCIYEDEDFYDKHESFSKKTGQGERREVGVGIGGDLLIYDFHIQKNRSLKL